MFRQFQKIKYWLPLCSALIVVLALSTVRCRAANNSNGIIVWPSGVQSQVVVQFDSNISPSEVIRVDDENGDFLYYDLKYIVRVQLFGYSNKWITGNLQYTVPISFSLTSGSGANVSQLVDPWYVQNFSSGFAVYRLGNLNFYTNLQNAHTEFLLGNVFLEVRASSDSPAAFLQTSVSEHSYVLNGCQAYDVIQSDQEVERSIYDALNIWDDPLMDEVVEIRERIGQIYHQTHADASTLYNLLEAFKIQNNSNSVAIYNKLDEILDYIMEREQAKDDAAEEWEDERAEFDEWQDDLDIMEEDLLEGIDDIDMDSMSDGIFSQVENIKQSVNFWNLCIDAFSDDLSYIWFIIIVNLMVIVVGFILRLRGV